MHINKFNSTNYDGRKNDISMIVIHCTETATMLEAHQYYMNEGMDSNAGKISPHYMIDKDGTINQYVDEKHRAWHAGKAYWRGITDINSASIGIELVNQGKSNNYPEYSKLQMDALIWICKDIKVRNEIPKINIVGHSDISPARKTDPDKHFDWKYLSDNGVGFFPEINNETSAIVNDIDHIKTLLTKIGYNPKSDINDIIQSINSRYLSIDSQYICRDTYAAILLLEKNI